MEIIKERCPIEDLSAMLTLINENSNSASGCKCTIKV